MELSRSDNSNLTRSCVSTSVVGVADVRGMGVMAGAVVGVSFGVLLIILIIWLVFRKKEMQKYEEEETPNEIRYLSVPNLKFQAYLFP